MTGLSLMVFAMFSARQRAWIKKRDNFECQACKMGLHHSRECLGSPNLPQAQRKLQVHHIIPQRYAKAIGLENVDFAENGITLGASFHQEDIHPDMKTALQKYRTGERTAFRQVGVDRDAILNEGVIYWNDRYDRLFSTRAIQNTQRVIKDEPFPEK